MKKRRKKLPPGSPLEWLTHAMSDLALARLGVESEEVLPEQVCFHAQQAVEKAIKAVLLKKRIRFPLIHDLDELIEIARQGGCHFPDWANDLGNLTPYAIETRYPGAWEAFQETEVTDALEVAGRMVEWAQGLFAS